MTTLVKRRTASPLAEIIDWFETWPAVTEWRHDATHTMRVEDRVEEDRYVLRAELPGIDPEKDASVTVNDGVLTITAERRDELSEGGRSEFHYGCFERQVTLPQRALESGLTAHYQDGILEVVVPLGADAEEPRVVPVTRTPAV